MKYFYQTDSRIIYEHVDGVNKQVYTIVNQSDCLLLKSHSLSHLAVVILKWQGRSAKKQSRKTEGKNTLLSDSNFILNNIITSLYNNNWKVHTKLRTFRNVD